MKIRCVIWALDGLDDRGGSIYIRRLIDWRRESGVNNDVIIKRVAGLGYLRWGLEIVWKAIRKSGEVRGTCPLIIPIALVSPRAMLYVQSPISEWSLISRLLFRLIVARRGIEVVCVSRYLARLAHAYGVGPTKICYAKITDNMREKQEPVRERKDDTWVALMDSGIVTKGYLDHLSVLTSVQDLRVRICIYEKAYSGRDLREYEKLGELRFFGNSRNPFMHFNEMRQGEKGFYLGMSRFEGLHMAVVEAGLYSIPALLSDIPAHRELELISGTRLEIYKTSYGASQSLRRAVRDSGIYEEMVARSRMLGKCFQEVSLKKEFLGL